jgi:hypothetical protein
VSAVDRVIGEALSGRRGQRWRVTGTDPRGEAFTITGYRSRHDAADFAAECNGNGGNVVVEKESTP